MQVIKEIKNNLVEVVSKFKNAKQIGFTISKLDLRIIDVIESQDPGKIIID